MAPAGQGAAAALPIAHTGGGQGAEAPSPSISTPTATTQPQQQLPSRSMKRTSSGVPPVPFRYRVLAASSGALLTSLITNPLDVVKTRLQVQPINTAAVATASGCAAGDATAAAMLPPSATGQAPGGAGCVQEWCMETVHGAHVYGPAPPATNGNGAGGYRGTLDALVKISQKEGLSGLYRGLGPSLLMAVPSTVLYYSLYDSLRGRIENAGVGPMFAPLLSGAGARTCAATVTAPLELVRTRAHTHHKDLALVKTMVKMVRAGGLTSLWTGLGAQLWRDVPFSAMYWLGYEKGVEALGQRDSDSQLAYMCKAFTAGAGAGTLAAYLTMPFDVIKTRTQVAPSLSSLQDPLPRHLPPPATGTALALLVKIAREEGVAALFKGWLPRVLRIGPACAIMISSYEGGKYLYFKTYYSSDGSE